MCLFWFARSSLSWKAMMSFCPKNNVYKYSSKMLQPLWKTYAMYVFNCCRCTGHRDELSSRRAPSPLCLSGSYAPPRCLSAPLPAPCRALTALTLRVPHSAGALSARFSSSLLSLVSRHFLHNLVNRRSHIVSYNYSSGTIDERTWIAANTLALNNVH